LVFLGFILLFAFFFGLLTYLLNFSAFNQKIAYWYRDQFGNTPHALSDAVAAYQSSPSSQPKNILPNIAENSIFIESIGVKAPITFGVDNNEAAVSNNLKNGPIQIAGTSLPGQMGNVFITGHSSNYPWIKSKYNSVFALLGNVVVGDLVQVNYDNINYVYRINNIFVVNPSDTSVMKSDNSEATLTLMTCTPVGTNLHRLIVQANQIIPSVSQNQPSTNQGLAAVPQGVH
jgi:LPXTG-site transpeptidase (sortase) family protein